MSLHSGVTGGGHVSAGRTEAGVIVDAISNSTSMRHDGRGDIDGSRARIVWWNSSGCGLRIELGFNVRLVLEGVIHDYSTLSLDGEGNVFADFRPAAGVVHKIKVGSFGLATRVFKGNAQFMRLHTIGRLRAGLKEKRGELMKKVKMVEAVVDRGDNGSLRVVACYNTSINSSGHTIAMMIELHQFFMSLSVDNDNDIPGDLWKGINQKIVYNIAGGVMENALREAVEVAVQSTNNGCCR